METIVIVGAKRSPIGKLGGSFLNTSAVELGTQVVRSLLGSVGINKEDVGALYSGIVLSGGLGQNISRQIALNSGLSYETLGTTVNEVCGSGMKAIELGMNDVLLGKHQVVIVGGVENMSQAPYLLSNARFGAKYNNLVTIDSINNDGLLDAFDHEPMGITAERVAEQFNVSREAQDHFAYNSQMKATHARDAGLFEEEIVSIETKKGMVSVDEGIRDTTTIEALSKLRPTFLDTGSVTAGNASTLNDGAAFLVLCTKSYADKHSLEILGEIEGFSEVGIDPKIMGVSPIKAIQSVLDSTNTKLEDVDVFEINEAFASQSIAIINDLNIDSNRINIRGGAISLGHPLGSSGARIVVTLLHIMKQENKKQGIASLCIGGGLGMAVLLKNNMI